MPEIPDLEAIGSFLGKRIIDKRIDSATVRIPVVVRASKDDFAGAIDGNHVRSIERQGKFLIFGFDHDLLAVVNPMLTGRFQYVLPGEKMHKKTSWLWDFEDGMQLRYHDDLLMGKLYLATRDTLDQLPRFGDMGPDALAVSAEEFRERIRKYSGMVKNVITNEKFIAGVGNAYSDEILWEAGFHPYRKRSTIDAEGVDRLYEATRKVLLESIPIVSAKMEESLDYQEWRDHLKVHRRGGDACPRCGGRISEITAGGRITSFCRACQPMS